MIWTIHLLGYSLPDLPWDLLADSFFWRGYRTDHMGTEKISESDTHVLHVCLDEDRPGMVLFRIEDARTRVPFAWVYLEPGDARIIAESILGLIEEIHDGPNREDL
jgi:hypothetical protein